MPGNDLKAALLLFLLFAIAVLIVNPIGNFPLDDDFAYAQTVKNFLEGKFIIHSWISATVIFQTIVGVIFSLPFGFSFTALRFSSILFAYIGAVAFYLLLRELGIDSKKSFIGALILLFNPLYFSKAFNFHSDMHFMAVMLLSVLFYLKAVRRKNDIQLLALGSLFAIFAILTRQNGTLIPFAAFIYMWLSRKKTPFKPVHFLVVAIIPFIASVLYGYWFYFVHPLTESSSLMTQYNMETLKELVTRLIPFRLFSIFIYIGLLCLPLSFFTIRKLDIFLSKNKWQDNAIFVLLLGGAISGIVFMAANYGKILFYMPTMIHSHGLGPAYLQGIKAPEFNSSILMFLAVFSAISAAIIFTRMKTELWNKASRLKMDEPEFLVYWVGFFQLLFLMVVLAVFDRYLLPLFAPVIAFLLLRSGNFFSYKSAAVLVAMMALFSVAATQDYMAWNRAKNSAIDDLMAQGIPADMVDGGFEHAAWHFHDYSKANPGISKAKPYDPGWIKDYFPVIDSRYAVSFSQLENYRMIKEYNYFSLLTGTQKIYVLERP